MPYITAKDKNRINLDLDKVLLGTQGELTYAINRLMINFVEQRQDFNYSLSSSVMASCCDAKNEWAWRIHKKYEEHKIRENGDVFQELIRKLNI